MEEKKVNIVLCQTWSKCECGCRRPDGYSLHLTQKDYDAYVEPPYWAKMFKYVDIHSSPNSKPYACIVSDDVLAEIKASKYGIYRFLRPIPQRVLVHINDYRTLSG